MAKGKKAAAAPRKPRAKKAPTGGAKPIGETIEKVADGIQAGARDAFKPDVQRGPNVDVVNGRWKTTTKDQLGTIARQYVSASKSAKTASGAKAEILNKAEENKNLDKWCFKKAVEWMLMGDEVLVRRLPLFLKYLDDLGVSDRSTAQADLLDEAQRQADEKRKGDGEGEEPGDLVDQTERAAAADKGRKGDEARAAASGLAPSRRPTMTIVPKDETTPSAPDAA